MWEKRAGLEDELSNAERVKTSLEHLRNVRDRYPEGHELHEIIRPLHVDRVLTITEKKISEIKQALNRPQP